MSRIVVSILMAALIALAAQAVGCRVHEGAEDDTPKDAEVMRPTRDDDAYRSRGYNEAMRESEAGGAGEASDDE